MHRAHRLGLTLIEILVVMAVLAVLTALTLPTIGRVRDQAVRIQCMSNARQLVLAMSLYASRSQQSLPFPNWASKEAASAPALYRGQRGWLYQWDLARDASQFNDPDFVKTGLLYPYLNKTQVYHCPLDQGPWPPNTTRSLTSYLMNGAVCSYGSPQVPVAHSISAFKSNAALLWEAHEDPAADPGAWNDGANSWNQGPPTRHGRGGSVAFADGHVEWILAGEFLIETSRVPNRFNADPLTQGP